MNNTINYINNNKYFIGIMMILMNIGSKYAISEISILQHNFLKLKIVRRLLIFTIFFVATRDIIVSLFMTAIFVILAFELFNENSEYCILPEQLRKYDKNKDNQLSPNEVEIMYLDYKSKGLI